MNTQQYSRIRGIAYNRVDGRPDLFEDAAQEAAIAAWQASETNDNERYVTRAAVQGAVSVARGRPMTGAEQGRRRHDASALADPIPDGFDLDGGGDPAGLVEFAGVRAAVRALPERWRFITVARFWHGWSWRQIAERLGVSVSAPRMLWAESIRPHLAAELEGWV